MIRGCGGVNTNTYVPGVDIDELPEPEDLHKSVRYKGTKAGIEDRIGSVEDFSLEYELASEENGIGRYELRDAEQDIDVEQEYRGIVEAGLSPETGDVQFTMENGSTRSYNVLGVLEGKSIVMDEHEQVWKYDHETEDLAWLDLQNGNVEDDVDHPYTAMHIDAIGAFQDAFFTAQRAEKTEEVEIQGGSPQYFKSLINSVAPHLQDGPVTLDNQLHFGKTRGGKIGRRFQKAITRFGDFMEEQYGLDPQNVRVDMNANEVTIYHEEE